MQLKGKKPKHQFDCCGDILLTRQMETKAEDTLLTQTAKLEEAVGDGYLSFCGLDNWAKKNRIPCDLFWVMSQNKTKEVVILGLTLTAKAESLYEVEDGGAFEDSDYDLLKLFLAHFEM